MATEAARGISEQMQRAFAGLEIPAPDMSAFDAAAREVADDLDRLRAGAEGDPLELPVEVEPGALPKAEAQLKGFFDRAGDMAQKAFFLRDAVGSFVSGVSSAVQSNVAPFVDFEQRMANVNTLFAGSDNAFVKYEDDLLALVGTTRKSAADLTDGLYQVVSAFGATDDTLAITETNAKAAAAGLATTEQAIALTASVTKGYGDASKEAVAKAADFAFMTVKLGQTDFPQLAASIGGVVPLAQQLGVTQEELFAVMATATGVTGNASEVTTQFQGVLQAIMNPTEGMTKLLAANGYASGEAALKTERLSGVLRLVTQAAEASGKPLADFVGSIDGQVLAMNLAGPQAEKFKANLESMGDVSGSTAEAFNRNTATLKSSLDNVTNQFEVIRIRALSAGDGIVKGPVDALGALLGKIAEGPKWFNTFVVGVDTMAGAAVSLATSGLVPMIAYIPRVVGMIRSMVAATWAWVTAGRTMAALTGVGLVLAIGSFAVAAASAAEVSKLGGDAFVGMGESAKTATSGIDALANSVDQLTDAQVRAGVASAATVIQQVASALTQARIQLEEAERQAAETTMTRGQNSMSVPTERAREAMGQVRALRDQVVALDAQLRQAGASYQTLVQRLNNPPKPTTTPPVRLPGADVDQDAVNRAQQAAERAADQRGKLTALEAEAEAIAHEAEIARIADEGERRRAQIAETYRAAAAAAEAEHTAELGRIAAETISADEAGRRRAIATQTRENALASARIARDTATDGVARAQNEQAHTHALALLDAQDRVKARVQEETHARELADTDDEDERRGRSIQLDYERARDAAQRKYEIEQLRIGATATSQAEMDRALELARLAHQDALGQAEAARITATAEHEERQRKEQERKDDERLEKMKRDIERAYGLIEGAVADALAPQTRMTGTEIDLERLRFEQQEEALRESLRKREITQREYDLQVRQMADDRAAFERRLDDDRAGTALRLARSLTSALLAEAQRYLVGKLVRYTAESLAHAAKEATMTGATAAGTATRSALNLGEIGSTLASAGAKMVDAIASAIRGVAGLPFPANVLLGGAAVAGITALFAAAKNGLGFAAGGYTGDGDRMAPAGTVHRGEFVFTKAQVGGDPGAFYALGGLLNSGWTARDLLGIAGLGGYADGGYVSVAPVVRTSSRSTSSTFDDSRTVAAIERLTFETQQQRREIGRLESVARRAPLDPATERRRVQLADARERQTNPRRRGGSRS